MPEPVLRDLPAGWRERATSRAYGLLELTVPAPADLPEPKPRRNEPRDRAHAAWSKRIGLVA